MDKIKKLCSIIRKQEGSELSDEDIILELLEDRMSDNDSKAQMAEDLIKEAENG